MPAIRIGLIGDRQEGVLAHVAIPRALERAASLTGCELTTVWLPTQELEGNAASYVEGFDGLWCVPASPYNSMVGALKAIRIARERAIPFLGTCGGFQHALIEYARNVLGLSDADHAESNPDAPLSLIAPLACSLVEEEETIRLKPGSRFATIYGATEIREQYHCRFGLNPVYRSLFEDTPLHVAGVGADEEVRAMELAGHPFYLLTLFQPERAALRGVAPPIACAFVSTALNISRPTLQLGRWP